MRHSLTAFLALVALASAGVNSSAQPIYDERTIDGKEIVFHLANDGSFARGLSDSDTGLAYRSPNGLVPYLSGGGIWFAGQRRSADTMEKLAFVTFDPATGRSWAAPGVWTTAPPRSGDSLLYRVYDSREHDPVTGEFLGAGEDLPAWPLWERYNPGRAIIQAEVIW
jgi:hypothetical protein